ncbi:GNAT family N-acetyltransferase [Sodalis sp. dw_96]|uniref:GNAT family N-acetyltransferase n=1 Tax=Sodalis sp. dw_96 TaxID=2719794 RepID=UPI001BD4E1DC|nr:GNAT family N-acetyltransferase [Sodalis sp. dw_96]
MLVSIKGHGKEFDAYRTIFIHEYEMDLTRNHKLSEYEAHEKAVNIIDSAFLGEVGITNNSLFRIVKTISGAQHNVGYIWILSSKKDKSPFVMDFYILPEYRKQSLGTEALTELFYQLAQNGNTAITLRVDPDNQPALNLYKKVGFNITGINMARKLNSAPY